MGKYLIDTNVISHYLSATLSNAGLNLMDKAINSIPNLSIITKIELLCWDTDENTSISVKEFIADCQVIDISNEIVAHCVVLRKGRKIKTPDAIIAATAIAYNYTLITGNEKDFLNIRGLKIINPHKL